MVLDIVEYLANGLLDVFSMDLNYFSQVMPVTNDIVNIIIASAWALLLGNLVFGASKSMMSGIGLEGEDPKTLFTRTFLFGFLLLASRQVCEIGLGISGTVIDMLVVPDSVSISLPDSNVFGIGASWLLMIIVGVVLMWQIVKLFLQIGERYFLVGFLTISAPWAFAMGGSKNTADIFKGWVRMYSSMCLMMVLNVVFLKLMLSAMGNIPDDGGIIAWLILVIAVARVARKIDGIILRIGLNPASTSDGLGRSFLGNMASYVVMRSVSSNVMKAVGGMTGGKAKTPAGGAPPPSGFSGRNTAFGNSGTVNRTGTSQNTTNNQSAGNSASQSQTSTHAGTAGTAAAGVATGTPSNSESSGTAANQSGMGDRQYYGTRYQAGGTAQHRSGTYQNQVSLQGASRRSSVPVTDTAAFGTRGAYRPGTAGTAHGLTGTAGTRPQIQGAAGQESRKPRPSRYTAVLPNMRGGVGTHGTAGTPGTALVPQGGVTVNSHGHAETRSDVNSVMGENSQRAPGAAHSIPGYGTAHKVPNGTRGVTSAPTESRKSSVPLDSATKKANTGQAVPNTTTPRHSRNAAPDSHGTFGTRPDAQRHSRNAVPDSTSMQRISGEPRHSRNDRPAPTGTNFTAARRESGPEKRDTPRKSQHSNGTAGMRAKPPQGSLVRQSGGIGQGTRRLDSTNNAIHGSEGIRENRKTNRITGDDNG